MRRVIEKTRDVRGVVFVIFLAAPVALVLATGNPLFLLIWVLLLFLMA